jgi:predicted CXXCH cytochrome family protein
MKRIHLAHITALAVAGLALPAMAQTMVGQGHDFSSMSWSGGEICKPCHTPHNAMAGMNRLWNHELTVATYTMHGGTGTAEADFDTKSRLCLSCHDGTVALDSFGGQTGSSFIGGRENLGTDLTDDHPVGSDAEYPPDPPPSWWSHAFKDEADLPGALRLQNWVDPDGATQRVVSCTTCHTPHYDGFDHQLTMTNSDSAICLGCHLK